MVKVGVIASLQSIDIEGIGAETKAYYWENAFIREFIATLVSEKKSNLILLIIIAVIIIILNLISFI